MTPPVFGLLVVEASILVGVVVVVWRLWALDRDISGQLDGQVHELVDRCRKELGPVRGTVPPAEIAKRLDELETRLTWALPWVEHYVDTIQGGRRG